VYDFVHHSLYTLHMTSWCARLLLSQITRSLRPIAMKASTARFTSSSECEADSWTRIRAFPEQKPPTFYYPNVIGVIT